MSEYKKQFVELFDKYHSDIYRFLRLKVSINETAQDLTSEAFLRAWDFISRNPERFPQNPRAYLYQTARNCLADYYRRTKKPEVPLDDSVLEVIDKNLKNDIMEADLLSADFVQTKRLHAAIKELATEEAELVTLRYIDDFSNSEIAEITGKNEGAVRVTLHRAIDKLRKNLPLE